MYVGFFLCSASLALPYGTSVHVLYQSERLAMTVKQKIGKHKNVVLNVHVIVSGFLLRKKNVTTLKALSCNGHPPTFPVPL